MKILLITLLSTHTHYHIDFLKFNSEKLIRIKKSAVPLINLSTKTSFKYIEISVNTKSKTTPVFAKKKPININTDNFKFNYYMEQIKQHVRN